ncbi:hypothetical protein TSOC_004088, partial [Tetrabaena socialis]
MATALPSGRHGRRVMMAVALVFFGGLVASALGGPPGSRRLLGSEAVLQAEVNGELVDVFTSGSSAGVSPIRNVPPAPPVPP